MAHASGWIELYGMLEDGLEPSRELIERCRSNRNGLGENMLHWYAIEGDPNVLQRLVDFGYDIDNVRWGGGRPILDAARIRRWDNVRVLRKAGARFRGVDSCGYSYRGTVTDAGSEAPEDLRADAYQLEDLLDPMGPEDTEVTGLVITRHGLPTDSPGERLHATAWADYLSRNPDLNEGLVLFYSEGPSCRGSYVEFVMPDMPMRRQAKQVAEHFGARVLWRFACPDISG